MSPQGQTPAGTLDIQVSLKCCSTAIPPAPSISRTRLWVSRHGHQKAPILSSGCESIVARARNLHLRASGPRLPRFGIVQAGAIRYVGPTWRAQSAGAGTPVVSRSWSPLPAPWPHQGMSPTHDIPRNPVPRKHACRSQARRGGLRPRDVEGAVTPQFKHALFGVSGGSCATITHAISSD